MSFDQYYQDELAYLNEMGEAFADAYPKLAPFLAQKGHDPDVERLLEGFAFIAANIRQKLDDELPEITHGLHNLLWPNLLRPVPSVSIAQFTPIENALTNSAAIERGVQLDSIPVQDTVCKFKTTSEITLQPISINYIQAVEKNNRSVLEVKFTLDSQLTCDQLIMESLQLFLYGDVQSSFSLYQYMFRYLDKVSVYGEDRDKHKFTLSNDVVKTAGLEDDEAMLEYENNSFSGYRLLQEYFSLPHKFLFMDVTELAKVSSFEGAKTFSLEFEFSQRFHEFMRINDDSLLLHCAPIINLFETEADPLRFDQSRTEYRLRPANSKQEHYEVYRINNVIAYAFGGKERLEYKPFVSFDNLNTGEKKEFNFYSEHKKPSVVGAGSDTYLSFISADKKAYETEALTVSIDLQCTNKNLPENLKVGDICVATGSSPEYATFKNIFPPTPSAAAPLHKDLQWQLISNISLNYMSLADIDTLRTILSTYNFHAANNRQAARSQELKLEAIESISISPVTRLVKGLPVRGHEIELDLRSDPFGSEGEMFLFATILSRFFALCASVNSFSELVVNDLDKGEVYRWPKSTGQKYLI